MSYVVIRSLKQTKEQTTFYLMFSVLERNFVSRFSLVKCWQTAYFTKQFIVIVGLLK